MVADAVGWIGVLIVVLFVVGLAWDIGPGGDA